MASNSSTGDIRTERETRCWDLRQRGWSQRRIAEHLGINQGTVCRILDAVERRELARLGRRVERQKVEQTYQLDHIIDESLEAWERSKKPKVKTGKRSGGGGNGKGGGETTVSEVTQREGEPAFLDRALAALDRKRALWGLDAPRAKPKDDDAAGTSVSAVAARLKEANDQYEASNGPESQASVDAGGSGEMEGAGVP